MTSFDLISPPHIDIFSYTVFFPTDFILFLSFYFCYFSPSRVMSIGGSVIEVADGRTFGSQWVKMSLFVSAFVALALSAAGE